MWKHFMTKTNNLRLLYDEQMSRRWALISTTIQQSGPGPELVQMLKENERYDTIQVVQFHMTAFEQMP